MQESKDGDDLHLIAQFVGTQRGEETTEVRCPIVC